MLRLLRSLLVAVFAFSTPLLAQSYGQVKGMDERLRMDFGGFFMNFDTTVRLDPSGGGSGTEISFEDDLGMDDEKATFRLDGYWRFGRHGRVDFGYLTMRRRNENTLSRQIVWGDQVYDVGASVDTSSKVDVVEAYYSYSFVNTGEAEIGLGIGVSSFFNRWSVEAAGSVSGGGGTGAGAVAEESTDLVAPIPAVGAHLRYTLLPGFFAHGRVRWMKASISDYQGKMLSARAGLDVYFGEHFGIGAVWDFTDITFEEEREKGTVEFEYRFSGPVAYLTIAF